MTELSRTDDVWKIDLGDDHTFTDQTVAAFNDCLYRIESGNGPVALVVAATGKKFSTGLDLGHLATLDDKVFDFVSDVEDIFDRLLALPMATVAAINGHAYAAGAMLALACDVRIMNADRGFFRLPEVELGVDFTDGFGDLIAAKVPTAALVRATVLGERFGAADAQALGIIDHTAPASEVAAVAQSQAEQLRSLAGPTIAAIRRRFVPPGRTRTHQ